MRNVKGVNETYIEFQMRVDEERHDELKKLAGKQIDALEEQTYVMQKQADEQSEHNAYIRKKAEQEQARKMFAQKIATYLVSIEDAILNGTFKERCAARLDFEEKLKESNFTINDIITSTDKQLFKKIQRLSNELLEEFLEKNRHLKITSQLDPGIFFYFAIDSDSLASLNRANIFDQLQPGYVTSAFYNAGGTIEQLIALGVFHATYPEVDLYSIDDTKNAVSRALLQNEKNYKDEKEKIKNSPKENQPETLALISSFENEHKKILMKEARQKTLSFVSKPALVLGILYIGIQFFRSTDLAPFLPLSILLIGLFCVWYKIVTTFARQEISTLDRDNLRDQLRIIPTQAEELAQLDEINNYRIQRLQSVLQAVPLLSSSVSNFENSLRAFEEEFGFSLFDNIKNNSHLSERYVFNQGNPRSCFVEMICCLLANKKTHSRIKDESLQQSVLLISLEQQLSLIKWG